MSAVRIHSKRLWRAMYVGILLVVHIALTSCGVPGSASPVETATAKPKPRSIIVRITNPNVEGAIARVSKTEQVANLDGDVLALESCSEIQYISVWAPGYYIETFPCNGESKFEYPITLKPINAADNPNYGWIDADIRSNPALNCATCHSDSTSELNEYVEWNMDGHSRVFVDSYFWNMYMGTNTQQNPGSAEELAFRSDYPGENGNCLFCHAPAALQVLQQGTDLATWNAQLPGKRISVETEGITCDVCHKVADVLIGEDGRPFAERPGVLSLALSRPSAGELFYFGPWADHKPGVLENNGGVEHIAACAPIFSEGRFCAACHYGKFFDTVIYNSYGEWLDSDYSKKKSENYRSCQDCHMQSSQPVDGSSLQARSACSQKNHSFRDFGHNMMKRDNTGNPILIQGAANVTVNAKVEQGKLEVEVTVENTRAGHKFPTDSPLRHLILVVEAKDKNDKLLAQLEGPVIPEWGGSDDKPGGYAGQPGMIYGNILKDRVTGTVPAVAYWNSTIPAWEDSDTRLVPLEKAVSKYAFVAPVRGKVTVTARLFYRYAFIDIIYEKGWPIQDVLVNWASAKAQ